MAGAVSPGPGDRGLELAVLPVVTATTGAAVLTTFSPSTGATTIGPHAPHNVFLERSNDGRTFATYGLEDLVEVWSSTTATRTRTRLFSTGQGSVSQLHFVGDTADFITSGHDGRLIRWASADQGVPLVQLDQPIDRFELIPEAGSFVLSTADGTLWRLGGDGHALALRPGGSRVNRLLALPAQQSVYAGYANGDVIAINTQSWQQEVILHGSGAVREIAATSDGHVIAVATNDGAIHVGTRRDGATSRDEVTWVALEARARHITLAPDGLLVAACTDGTIWLYAAPRRRWLCLPTGTADPGRTAMTDDGTAAVSLDREGRLIWIDLEAARKLFEA